MIVTERRKGKKMAIDIMIDLETCGTRPGCILLTLGAASFSLENNFYEKFSKLDGEKWGFKKDPETMAWWDKQSPEARAEAFSGTTPVIEVLGKFSDYITSFNQEVFVWGNGADFDLPLLAAYYNLIGMKLPWKPYNGRCYRTLKNLYKDIKMDAFEGMKHSALADAKNQARHAHKILKAHFAKPD